VKTYLTRILCLKSPCGENGRMYQSLHSIARAMQAMRRTTQRREAKAFPSTAHHRNFLLCSQSGRSTVISVTENTNMSKPSDLVQGTLDMLLLKILALEPMNGFAVSQRLKQVSGDALQVSDGSLYPALPKLEQESWITAEWKRRQLEKEADNWGRLSSAISRVVKLKEA